jgi:NAD-reducing hydrogenase large subunit
LSFFYLSAPDFLLGFDSDPAKRNVLGLAAADPELARRGIRARQFGQLVIEYLGGKRIHPAWAVPGGVRSGLDEADRLDLLARLPEVKETVQIALNIFKGYLDKSKEEVTIFGNFPSLFMSLVGPNDTWEHYGGKLRFVDAKGNIVADGLDANDYRDFIGEAVEPYSYLKFPYYKPLGYPQGIYRVGPLARLNTCKRMGTELADKEFVEYHQRFGVPNSSFLYHYARLIETMASVEIVERLLNDPEILDDNLRADAGINRLHSVGVSEAPRGTLFHDYEIERTGAIKKVNLIIATGQNNLAMNRTVAQIAKHYIQSSDIPEGVLNRIEAGIRNFDPCLSCSTHAYGQMPMAVELIRADGSVADRAIRG